MSNEPTKPASPENGSSRAESENAVPSGKPQTLPARAAEKTSRLSEEAAAPSATPGAPTNDLSLDKLKTAVAYYAAITSTIAVLISFTTLWFSFFREYHSLQVGVVRSTTDDTTLPVSFVVDVVLLNRGNKTETLLDIDLEFIGDGILKVPATSKGPYVLKAGDAVPVKIAANLTQEHFEIGAVWKGPATDRTAECFPALSVRAVGANGAEKTKSVQLGKLTYHEPSDVLSFVNDSSTRILLIEALR